MIPQVAVIGCGYWGKNLVRNFRQLGELRMVCDGAEAGRKLAAEIAPHAEVVADEENILWSFAPHDIAIILRLMGAMPFQVVACGGSYVQPNIADVTVTHLLFDNGVRAHIYVSWLPPFKEQRLVVIGSRKMASFDDVVKRLVLYDQRVDLREGEPIPVKGDGEEVPFSSDEPLRLECQAFLSAMETRRPPLTDGASGLRVLKVLQAAQRSLVMNGEPVTLPMEAFA
jgi:predicted dehydrogenase